MSKILIIGRTATGKDTLQAILEEKYHWKFVKSVTTRPKRHPNEDTHVFLSEEEAAKIPKSDYAAWTKINGYEYFATKDQVNEADAYIIDPEGAYMLLSNMPDTWFRIIYLRVIDENTRKEMAIKRSDKPEHELQVFQTRAASEDAQFTAFEQKTYDSGCFALEYPNCDEITVFDNNYIKEEMEQFAKQMEEYRRFETKCRIIIEHLIQHDIMNHDENGNPMLQSKNKKLTISIDQLIEYLSQNKEMLGDMAHRWLSLADTSVMTS